MDAAAYEGEQAPVPSTAATGMDVIGDGLSGASDAPVEHEPADMEVAGGEEEEEEDDGEWEEEEVYVLVDLEEHSATDLFSSARKVEIKGLGGPRVELLIDNGLRQFAGVLEDTVGSVIALQERGAAGEAEGGGGMAGPWPQPVCSVTQSMMLRETTPGGPPLSALPPWTVVSSHHRGSASASAAADKDAEQQAAASAAISGLGLGGLSLASSTAGLGSSASLASMSLGPPHPPTTTTAAAGGGGVEGGAETYTTPIQYQQPPPPAPPEPETAPTPPAEARRPTPTQIVQI